jgi:hypothetical protein
MRKLIANCVPENNRQDEFQNDLFSETLRVLNVWGHLIADNILRREITQVFTNHEYV